MSLLHFQQTQINKSSSQIVYLKDEDKERLKQNTWVTFPSLAHAVHAAAWLIGGRGLTAFHDKKISRAPQIETEEDLDERLAEIDAELQRLHIFDPRRNPIGKSNWKKLDELENDESAGWKWVDGLIIVLLADGEAQIFVSPGCGTAEAMGYIKPDPHNIR